MKNLAIRIYKTENKDIEFSIPLVSVGDFPDNFKPRTPRIVDEQESWLVIHANEYTQYSYHVKNNASLYSVYLLVPATKKISQKDSTYDLLTDAYKLTTIQEGLGFNEEAFEGLLKNYVLDEDEQLTIPFMSGKEPASFKADSKTQIAALLKFNKYKQLESVCQLEIGLSCETTINLPIKSKVNRVSKPSSTTPTTSKQKVQPKQKKKELSDYSSNVTTLEGPKEKNSTTKRNIVLALTFIAACVIGLIFIVNKGNSDMSEDDILAQNEASADSIQEETPVTKSYGIETTITKQNNNKTVNVKEENKDRARIVELANEGNLTEIHNVQIDTKCLTKAEVNAIEVVMENVKVVFPQSTPAMHEKLKNTINAAKPFKCVQDIVNLRKELLDIALGKKKDI